MGMDKKAADLLGETVRELAIVARKGGVRTMAVAGGVGGLVGAPAEAVVRPDATQVPDSYKGFMVLALTPARLAFIEYRQGLLRPSLG
jgi:hypothetical protein